MRFEYIILIVIILLIGGFGYFYIKDYYPLKSELIEYKEENSTLISVVNELRRDVPKENSISIKFPTENYVAEDLRDMIDGIEVEQVREEISITLPGKKLFPPGSVELSEDGKEMLFKIASIIKEIEDRKIIIEGHTDNTQIAGSLRKEYPTNWDLSAEDNNEEY